MSVLRHFTASICSRPHCWFWMLLLSLQIIAILMWETIGAGMFDGIVRSNPDPLDRRFYGSIAAGMRTAMLIVIALSAVAAWLSSRIRPKVQHHDDPRIADERRIIIAFMAFSACMQLALLFWLSPPPFSDSRFYVEHARRLAETGCYIASDGSATAFWPVGYPAFLAILKMLGGNMLLWGRVANVFFSLVIVYASWRLFAEELQRRERLLLVAILAFHPMLIFGASPLMTEQAFLACLMAALFFLTRKHRLQQHRRLAAVVVGLLFGGMSYLRPTGLLIAGALLIVYSLASGRNDRLRFTVAAAVVMLLTLLPWTVRNFKIFDHPVPVATNGGYNFLMGNHAGASGGLNFDFTYPADENEAVASQEAYAQGIRSITERPWNALVRLPAKVLYSYRRGDAAVLWSVKPVHEKLPDWLLALFMYAGNFAWYVLVFFGILAIALGKVRVQRRLLRVMLFCLAGTLFLLILLYVGGERYVFPLLPLHAFLFVRFFRQGRHHVDVS